MLIFITGGQTSLPHAHSISVFFFHLHPCVSILHSLLFIYNFFFHSPSFALISLSNFSTFFSGLHKISLCLLLFYAICFYVFVLHLFAFSFIQWRCTVWSLHSRHAIHMELQECSSCQNVSCYTWASTFWVIRMRKRDRSRERETGDRVLDLYLQCIITLVFRPGPTEPSFWTWPCIKLHFPCYFFPSFVFFCAVPSNRNTFAQCLSGVPSLDFSLQTALHACLGTSWHRQQPDWRVQWQIPRDPRNHVFFLLA